MDLQKLKTIINIINESDISELEITEGADRVKIVKKCNQKKMERQLKSELEIDSISSVEQKTIESNISITSAVSSDHVIKSPMVGTFYRSPIPDADPFVKIGDIVKIGQILCIVEAMKLLNEIESDRNGVIKNILCENGQGVEFGQSLFIIV